jgi:hypothetical protein
VCSVAAACAVATACASERGSRSVVRPPETPAALSTPEPDPACHGTVQGLLAKFALETVTVKLALDPGGRVELVELLSPELTPAARAELHQAFASCAWAGRFTDRRTEVVTTTRVRE